MPNNTERHRVTQSDTDQTASRALPVADQSADAGNGVDRRDAVRMLGAASLAVMGLGAPDVARAADYAVGAMQQGAPVYKPIFFTKAEWPMVRALGDLVIPKDATSGSASDAGVPEFMDFIMNEYKGNQKWMREGLAWMNAQSAKRFKKSFTAITEAQQKQILDDIAFPKKAKPEFKEGVQFFTRFRDLTSSGFWTSRVGVKDIGYMGNMTMAEWVGCPEPQLKKIGVSYKMSMKAVRRS